MNKALVRRFIHSFYEASARERVRALLDTGSFQEFVGPKERVVSPHLRGLGLPEAFDDGVVIGSGLLEGAQVLIAAQEAGFMGGGVGEVHGAKIVGLLERGIATKPAGILLLLDSGGVRLHEANAGLIAVANIMRSVLAVRSSGVPCVALIGGTNGCFGGMSIVARCCDTIIMSEEGRLGLSGPEVIETVAGVEEFDARDRALVWRTMGGKHRYLLGEAQRLVDDDIHAFRVAAHAALTRASSLNLAALEAEHNALEQRLTHYGDCQDAPAIWSKMGLNASEQLSLLDAKAFVAAAAAVRQDPYAAG